MLSVAAVVDASGGREAHMASTARFTAALLIAWLAAPGIGFAQTKPLEMKWNELSPLLSGHRVTLTLTDGSSVQGEAVAIRDDGILMDVSTAVQGYAKGSGSVPRASIVLIDLQRTKGSWGRVLGTVIGVLGGIALGVYVDARNLWSSSAGQETVTFVGIAAAGALTGYFGGKAIDRRVTHIRIVP
jgi:hypothetical protein